MTNSETIECIRVKLAEIDDLLDDIESPITDPQEPIYPSWLPLIQDTPPNHFADYINGHYWANGAQCIDLDAYLTATGFAGTSRLDDGLTMSASANAVFPSNDMTGWSKTGVSVVIEDGWNKITESTSNSSHEIYKSVAYTSGTTKTLGITAKAGTCTKFRLWLTAASIGFYAIVDLAAETVTYHNFGTGSALGAAITDLGSGEYRVNVTGFCAPVSTVYYDISMMNGTAWQYTGTSRTLYVKEAQFGADDVYVPTTISAVTLPASLLTRTIAEPASITELFMAKTGKTSATDYEVLSHIDNDQNNSNYADVEVFRYTSNNLWARVTHLNTVYQQFYFGAVPNDTKFNLALTASADGFKASFNGDSVVSAAGDTYNGGLIKERINGNITGDRKWNGKLLKHAVWFNVIPTNTELEAL